jgi:hypothetical protein
VVSAVPGTGAWSRWVAASRPVAVMVSSLTDQGYCVVERQGSELGIHGVIGLCGGEGGG